MYYLIHTEYVGPNQRDSAGNILGDTQLMTITTEPGQTNASHETRIEGWLGTTNDYSATARGEYETLEQAIAAANAMGYTIYNADADGWLTPEGAREAIDADDWFGKLSHAAICDAYNITATTTDAELAERVETAEQEARLFTDWCPYGIELYNTQKLFFELRDQLREEEPCK